MRSSMLDDGTYINLGSARCSFDAKPKKKLNEWWIFSLSVIFLFCFIDRNLRHSLKLICTICVSNRLTTCRAWGFCSHVSCKLSAPFYTITLLVLWWQRAQGCLWIWCYIHIFNCNFDLNQWEKQTKRWMNKRMVIITWIALFIKERSSKWRNETV